MIDTTRVVAPAPPAPPEAHDDLLDRCAGDASLHGELAALARLGPDLLRRRWRTQIGRPMPKGLGPALMLRIMAYNEQVQRHGDLDKASQRVLAALAGAGGRDGAAEAKASPAHGPDLLRLGTMLSREHGGILHRVAVLQDGFAWNGRTYDSLSQVASAITGTRWNGPRFFGLRDKPAGDEGDKQSSNPKARAARRGAAVNRMAEGQMARGRSVSSRGAVP